MKSLNAALQSLAAAGIRAFLCCAAMVGVLSCGGGGGDAAPRGSSGPKACTPAFRRRRASRWIRPELGVQPTGGGEAASVPGADGDGGVGAGGDFGSSATRASGWLSGRHAGRRRRGVTDANSGMVTIVPRKRLSRTAAARAARRRRRHLLRRRQGHLRRLPGRPGDSRRGAIDRSQHRHHAVQRGRLPVADRRLDAPARSQSGTADRSRDRGRQWARARHRQPAVSGAARRRRHRTPAVHQVTHHRRRLDRHRSRGRYGLVNGAFSKQAAMFNPSRAQPTLDAVAQLGADLLDGMLDGMNGNQPAAGAAARTYDPHTIPVNSVRRWPNSRTASATTIAARIAEGAEFGNARYEDYLFDASLTARAKPSTPWSGWLGENTQSRTIGQAENKLPGEARVYGVIGNFGHGALYFRANTPTRNPRPMCSGTTSMANWASATRCPPAAGPRGPAARRADERPAVSRTRWRDGRRRGLRLGDNSQGQLGTAAPVPTCRCA